jgi:deoxyribonucleoside regulator
MSMPSSATRLSSGLGTAGAAPVLARSGADAGRVAFEAPTSGETRLMLRAAQLYWRLNLTQDEVGKRLGVSRFKVGRLLDRALREDAVRIEIVHPAARLVALEDALAERFDLRSAVVVDVPATGSAADDEQLARERVAAAAADHLAALHPGGAIGVSWGRTMLELAAHLQPGWTEATEIVQLNGAISRSARPTRAQEVVERFGTTTGAAIRLMAAPAIVGSAALRRALEADPAVGETLAAARQAPTAVFGMGVFGPESAHIASGYLDDADVAALREAGAVGDVLGRFLALDGRIALPALDERTVGLPLADLRAKPLTVGLAAGAGRGPVALAALGAGLLRVLVADEATAEWVLAHG